MTIQNFEGHGAPDVTIVGEVGDLYKDLDTGKVYQCSMVYRYAASQSLDGVTHEYVWKEKEEAGVSSWNDLTDKPFGDSEEPIVFYDGIVTTEEVTNHDGTQTNNRADLDGWNSNGMIIWKDFDIVYCEFDGELYEFDTASMEEETGNPTHTIGNLGLFNPELFEDNGEPCSITLYYEKFLYTKEPGTFRVKVYGKKIVTNTLDPKFLPEGYPSEEVEEIVITFDGDATDKEIVSNNTFTFVKVSDETFDYDDMTKALFMTSDSTDEVVLGEFYNATEFSEDIVYFGSVPLVIFVSKDAEMNNMLFSKGVYFFYDSSDYYAKRLRISRTNITTLDPKFLPEMPVIIKVKRHIGDFGIDYINTSFDEIKSIIESDTPFIAYMFFASGNSAVLIDKISFNDITVDAEGQTVECLCFSDYGTYGYDANGDYVEEYYEEPEGGE